MLFTLMHSPFQCDLTALIRTVTPGDDILLLQDGVIAGIADTAALALLLALPVSVSALRDDIEARGLSGQISSRIAQIDYTDFVNLTVKQRNQVAW
ncbi:sulfurtransferase complex subunit TusB [Apirhabdus apintestini]|uniref:sulfurtransferase complex subunit TusB n=1 Tax=Erwinia sp. HR93 TaxID=3094840 RepID=UPI002ADED6AE|nr:sulfurtransferase complex subunit TusB [Erwinia sp. HR93]MEA1063144.1 sulfurtransferase complex subunit TusB [Erwinia sp. HR93]WPM84641.1 sulfurtransferase complex subunit TusB [Enterobacteriaceae bacterium CA-0114]